VLIGDLSQAANLRLDQVLMAGMLPAVQLGWYVTAVSAAGLAQTLSTAVKMVVIPSVANQAEVSIRVSMLRRAFQRYWILSLIITLLVAVALPVLIPLVFGEEFRPSILVAEVLLLGALFIGAKEVLTGGAQALGNPWLGSRAELLALGVTVVLLLVLLPVMGIMGAAIASAAAYFASLVALVYGLRQEYVISVGDLFRIQTEDFKWVWSTAFTLARRAREKSHL
jgi:O-antigen/teichoic acid export membrane protein